MTKTDRLDARGGALWFGREEWGVVIDALIEHRGSAEARKAGNAASTSDQRADMCRQLIERITAAAAVVPTEPDRPLRYGIPSMVQVWR